MLIILVVKAGFGGAFWSMWIGGMLSGVLRVLPRMALVREFLFSCKMNSILCENKDFNFLESNVFFYKVYNCVFPSRMLSP